MISLLKNLTNFFIDPVNLIFIIILIAGIYYYRGKHLITKRLVFAAVIIYFLSATYFLPNILVGWLEKKYTPIDLESINKSGQKVDILVLGSGHTADPDLPPLGQLSATALQRLTEGIRILERIPESHLILSGYGDESAKSQAEVMFEAALSLQVPAESMSLQSEPTTTEEEASTYAANHPEDHTLILVTSASHMPRAMSLFKKKGLSPTPAPTAFEVVKDPEEPFEWDIFSARNFSKVEMALHEYVGMMWAWRRS